MKGLQIMSMLGVVGEEDIKESENGIGKTC